MTYEAIVILIVSHLLFAIFPSIKIWQYASELREENRKLRFKLARLEQKLKVER